MVYMTKNMLKNGIFIVLLFITVEFVYPVYSINATIERNAIYLLDTDDYAIFSCSQDTNIHMLKYTASGEAAEDPNVEIKINGKGKIKEWKCSKEYSISAIKSNSTLIDNNITYALASPPFNCDGDKTMCAAIYCQNNPINSSVINNSTSDSISNKYYNLFTLISVTILGYLI